MDLITDLTAEAISYITLIQDICKSDRPEKYLKNPEEYPLWEVFGASNSLSRCDDLQKSRIKELIWSSQGNQDYLILANTFFEITVKLLKWLDDYVSPVGPGKVNPRHEASVNASPDFWRQEIRYILYEKKGSRKELTYAIHYMPLQVVLVLAQKRPGLYNQRLYQVYNFERDSILSKKDQEKSDQFWKGDIDPGIQQLLSQERVLLSGRAEQQPIKMESAGMILLENNQLLTKALLYRKVALPFDEIFSLELDEISESRESRFLEWASEQQIPLPDEKLFSMSAPDAVSFCNDPQTRAANMKLAGLAFSGGGIRSATFNLGLLQKLASLGVLGRFDYLSTVSGGGYIGAWFAAWIRQTGSLAKVQRRLDPKKSGDPMGDEVRPIRWLRMFSNYLSPNSGIMSADAWTVGITWLRNTIINQVILLLLLLTFLAGIGALYQGWLALKDFPVHMDFLHVSVWSGVIMITGALMAGLGMRSYNRQHPPQSIFNLNGRDMLPHFLVIWAALSAASLSGWFYITLKRSAGLEYKLCLLLPSAGFAWLAMIIVAGFGGYHLVSDTDPVKKKKKQVEITIAVVLSSLVSAFAGYALLALSWQLMCGIATIKEHIIELPQKLELILGVPLILEVISLTVVIRMALMGNYFPDERREWWGRLGAILHRFMLIWVIVTTCSLILPDSFKLISKEWLPRIPSLLGGWAAIIGVAVKLAYQPGATTGKGSSSVQKTIDVFVRIAPYLFMVGFLLIGAYVLDLLRLKAFINFYCLQDGWRCLGLMIALGALTALISWRVGVNEFSLHDFYRNRLVRAYLGATRRRTDRENTANSFTGFDKDDDYPLALLRTKQKYIGPYPLVNTALNATVVSDLDRQDRKAESFIFSPLFCGFDFNPNRSASYQHGQAFEYGYRPTEEYSTVNGPLAGAAMAISGAAVNPNMGYHSSPATAFLLTVFNVRLGRWIGNPAGADWRRSDPVSGLGYLVKDLIGKSDISASYVSLSDGGHFDNMGLYELVRRRCSFIILGDAEQDANTSCEGLANAIRRCRIDFGVDIKIPDINNITGKNSDGFAKEHFAIGTIHYPGKDGLVGSILYIKTSMTGKESVDVREYFMGNPTFPQQSTGDQFFDEAQFESYRNLGYNSI